MVIQQELSQEFSSVFCPQVRVILELVSLFNSLQIKIVKDGLDNSIIQFYAKVLSMLRYFSKILLIV